MQAPEQKGTGGDTVLGTLAWVQGEPLGDTWGGRGSGATALRELLLRQSSLLLPGAASTISPSQAKKLWQCSSMHCLSERCWCPGVWGCVRGCVYRASCVGTQGVCERERKKMSLRGCAGWLELCPQVSGLVWVSSGGK